MEKVFNTFYGHYSLNALVKTMGMLCMRRLMAL